MEYPQAGLVAVPTKWLNVDLNKCKYPPKSIVNVVRMVINRTEPKQNWDESDVVFHHSYCK